MRAGLLLGLSLLLGCADGRASEPGWIELAPLAEPGGEPLELAPIRGRPVRLVQDDKGTWIEATLERSDWTADPSSVGTWETEAYLRGRGQPGDGSAAERLVGGTREFRYRTRTEIEAPGPDNFPPNHFHLARPKTEAKPVPGHLILRLKGGHPPPLSLGLRFYAGPPAAERDGRVDGRRFTGSAIPVLPGQSARVGLDLPAGRALRFATVSEPAAAYGQSPAGPVTFRVQLDGETLFEHVEPDVGTDNLAWHTVELPPGGRPGAQLVFEVSGTLAHTAFHAPVLGPADVGTYGDRPWGDTRPDVVVFLADTFRADNLAAYGSELGLTPRIDRLAQESRLFARTWSTATFTMPAHATMFSGLYARQAAATSTVSALPEEIVTVADRLAEYGYRTGAVTDAVVVSQQNNLDQGFAWFDEHHGTLESTVERAHAFLDADDGRPVFLFVQSYRTHTPYVVGPEVLRKHGRSLGIRAPFNKLSKELRELGKELGIQADLSNLRKATKLFYDAIYETPGVAPEHTRRYERLVEEFRGLYLGAVAELDRGFGTLHAGLVERGLDRSGYFLFTSDHGEAFNEHDKVFHGGKPWEETARVPLFFTGPGVEPGVVEHAASLIDFAPTVAAMARVEAVDGWLGRSLLGLDVDRPIFAFENQRHIASTLTIIDGDRKLVTFEDRERLGRGDVFAAFDLGEDPGETLDRSDELWPAELLERLGPAADTLLIPLYGAERGVVGPERMAELNHLGYGGD